ncbi:hypothetical protein [Alloprevotella tannerae]|uniref:hypothetical protein n=1 Tax=Alloprevotella tannerae TaxID=76122 RepID=UPI0028E467D3|nr:hypothetical protein [Alloprevotella tannerae]
MYEPSLVFVVHSCAVSLPFDAPSAEDDKGATMQNNLHESNDHPPRAAIAKGQTEQSENAPQSVE